MLTFRSFAAVVVVLALTVSTAVGPVAAQTQPAWGEEMYEQVVPMVGQYNGAVEDAEGAGPAGQLKGETVNFVVTDTDGSEANFSFAVDDQLKLADLAQGERDDATLRMSTDRATMEAVLAADSPMAFQQAILDGEIDIDGLGATNAVKWVIISTAGDIARWLGLF